MLIKFGFWQMKNFVVLSLVCSTYFLGVSCKKNDHANSTPILRPSKIEIISGNNQVGYPNKPLTDSILIKITPKNAADIAEYRYLFRSDDKGEVSANVSVINGIYYISALWTLGTTGPGEPTQRTTLLLYGNCSTPYVDPNTCTLLDSVVINATINYNRWSLVFDPSGTSTGPGEFWDMHFSDVMNGIAIGDFKTGLATTTDGGSTWTMSNTIRNDLYKLSFSSNDTGLAIVTSNYALFTNDGGRSFIAGPWTPPIIGQGQSADYFMLNRDTIFSVGVSGSISKTIDGGQSWTKYPGFTFINNLFSITCTSKDVCYACGEAGKIVKTVDGGTNWNEQDVLLNNRLRKVYFLDDNFGFAAGEGGSLARTEDGGNSWAIIKTRLNFTIIEIRFFSNTSGYIVSTGGEIARTTDGGLTWQIIVEDNYGVNTLNKALVKNPTLVYALQGEAIYKYDIK